MPRGGKRAGAGRKRGAATQRTRAIADRAVAEGITPLEVMLNAMRQYVAEGETEKAVAVAKEAAPYCHARLASTTIKDATSASVQANIEAAALVREMLKPQGDERSNGAPHGLELRGMIESATDDLATGKPATGNRHDEGRGDRPDPGIIPDSPDPYLRSHNGFIM